MTEERTRHAIIDEVMRCETGWLKPALEAALAGDLGCAVIDTRYLLAVLETKLEEEAQEK